MADLAYFIQQYQKEINQNFSLPESHKNKWFAVGGSYPGAMSAWFRLKYPHLVVGALSSSGVVKAILEFTEFDRQIARSAGPECASALREATKEIENNVAYSKVLFEAQNISDHDFWFYIADSAVEAIQYGHRHELCDQMLLAKSQGNSLAKQFANYTVNYFSKVMSSPPESYSSDIMADPKVDPLQGGRQWWWMTCTELAYFQIAPERDSIRSSKVTLEWHRQNCIKLFGEEVVSRTFPPDVEHTNAIYGGLDIHATNIYFTNGVEDPWQWASIRKTNRPGLDADVIDCEQCAHCQDLHTPSPDDAPALVHAREKFIRLLSSWLEMEPEHSEQYSTKIIL